MPPAADDKHPAPCPPAADTGFSWPSGRSFALLLSHDVDQIHDREMWRIVADINHIRRVAVSKEHGSIALAGRRLGRALLRPKKPTSDYQTILGIEARYGFRSTFFILHDKYWARYGARFRIGDGDLAAIAEMVKESGGEIGLHGGYYRFNDADAYRESRELLERTFDVQVTGIRNHLLKLSGEETWTTHSAAGFSYDATYPRRSLPFWAIPPRNPNHDGLVELPLTIMDGWLFRDRYLAGQAALDSAWDSIAPVIEAGGLVTLLWHSNYFNEPEYWDWQWVYEELLGRLAALNPWCATGAEIDRWWRSQQAKKAGPPPW